MPTVKCAASTCSFNVDGQCTSEDEVDLVFAGAWDFGGHIGTRVFLRCVLMELPQDKEWKKGSFKGRT
jgi:hypothetical protein